ncbi:retrovirus-related pol polyprotein from transposon TNT 1-94 [Tanacetum coccineum]
MVPRIVLTKSGPITLNTSRPVNTIQSRTAVNNAGPIKNIINNAYSTARRPFNKITTTNKSNFTKKVNIVKGTRVNTARPKAVLSAGNPQQDLKDKGVIDSGCSRHMTGNRSYLTDYEEIDGGFVAFGDFKLTDENHVLLKVPRKDNMYSVDLKNVVPQGGLTCFFVKATLDESNLWHRRLGHVEKPRLSFMRPFWVSLLQSLINTNRSPRRVEPNWLFDIDALTKSMNYKPVVAGNQSNGSAGTKACDDANKARMETVPSKDYILLPVWLADPLFSQSSKDSPDAGFKPLGEEEKKDAKDPGNEDSEVLSTEESRVNQEKDENIEATQEELLQFKLQHVWTLMDLPNGKRAIGTKWVFKNKKDERAIRLLLAYTLFKDFVVYQMDVKSAFIYGKIEKEVYVCKPPGFENPDFPDKVYKVEKALYGLHQAPRACKHRAEKNNDMAETHKPLLKDTDGEDVDERLYRSLIGSLMYLTSSRPDIMFAVCAYVRFQVNPKSSHLYAVKKIFRYLKGQPKLGLWYPKDSPFDLVAYTDSDYAGARLDRSLQQGEWNERPDKDEINVTVKAKTVNGEVQLQALVDKKKVIITESTIRRDLQLEDANGVNCLPNATIFEELTRIGKQKRKDTELPQSNGPTEPITEEAANEESVPTHSNDPLLSETSKTTQALEIESLKRRVKKLEKKQRSRTYKLRRLYKVGLSAKIVSSDDEAS